MKQILSLLVITQAFATFDFSKQPVDVDNVPICPALPSNASLWQYMDDAFSQAKTYVPPTSAQITNVQVLAHALHTHDAASILESSNALNAQVCRVKKPGDPFLVMITKPGITDYNGVFLLFRENTTSQIILQNAHDNTCTQGQESKDIFPLTNVLMVMSNGYLRSIGTRVNTCWGNSYNSDGSHNVQNLFYQTHVAFEREFNESIFIHMHGSAAEGMMITNNFKNDCGKDTLLYAFNNEVYNYFNKTDPGYLAGITSCCKGTIIPFKNMGITKTWLPGRELCDAQNPACDFGSVNTNRYIGFEHGPMMRKNPQILAKIIMNLQENYDM